jgi:hypothetical protein
MTLRTKLRRGVWRKYMDPAERDAVVRVVQMALCDQIRHHGVITSAHVGSASKRVVGALVTKIHNDNGQEERRD